MEKWCERGGANICIRVVAVSIMDNNRDGSFILRGLRGHMSSVIHVLNHFKENSLSHDLYKITNSMVRRNLRTLYFSNINILRESDDKLGIPPAGPLASSFGATSDVDMLNSCVCVKVVERFEEDL